MSTCYIPLVADGNFDGAFTISDVFLLIKHLIYLPSQVMINMVSDTSVGRFFELNFSSCTSGGSLVFSLLFWFVFVPWALK